MKLDERGKKDKPHNYCIGCDTGKRMENECGLLYCLKHKMTELSLLFL